MRRRLEGKKEVMSGHDIHKKHLNGLQRIVSALAGHVFDGHKRCSLAVWNLAPKDFLYVVRRADRSEEGWRRHRALAVLKRVTSVRRDLTKPISNIRLRSLWTGSFRDRILLKKTLKSVLGAWKAAGFFCSRP
jgi:hypothetical protein